jgi:hypothetical protein
MTDSVIPSKQSVYKGNRRYTKIVGGDELINDTADMLTEPLPAFEQRMAARYPDWHAFIAWTHARRLDAFAIAAAVTIVAALVCLPVSAQYDPCEVCQAEHGVAACRCLPVREEPEPVGGTIPPVTAIACIPDGPQPDISGCDDKVFMPAIAVTAVTGEGGSGILPVRGKP